MIRIAVLVSGGGSNLGALLDAQARNKLGGEIVLVLSSAHSAFALVRAQNAGVATAVVRRKDFADSESHDAAIEETLLAHGVDLVVMAGSLTILGQRVLRRYPRRILNIHPSLIPSFCGPGFHGRRVHQAALDYGVKVTGATVHFVSDVVDAGEILLQKAVDVEEGDTAETLQRRVMEQAEWTLLPKAVAMLCDSLQTERGMVNA